MEIGKEYPHPKEEQYGNEILDVLRESLEKDYPAGKMRRRFHAKSNGLLEAELRVEDNLPPELKVGLFENPEKFRALVRFSNSASGMGTDHGRSARGMAIKIMDAGKPAFEQDEMGNTQDILLITNKILFPGRVKDYLYSVKGLFGSFVWFIPMVLNPFNWKGIWKMYRANIRIANYLEEEYYSSTAYLFGEGRAVKWHARPAKQPVSVIPDYPGKDFLREQLVRDLESNSFSFDLCAQFQQNPRKEPIEDSGVEWKTHFVKLGVLTIQKQNFNSEQSLKLEETITFSPWHAIAEHRPLGVNNRLRRRIYRELSRSRNEVNGDPGA